MRLTNPSNGKQMPLAEDLAKQWAREYTQWRERECKHQRQELRRGHNKGGGPIVRNQCLDCGAITGLAHKRPANFDTLPGFDTALHPAYDAARKAELDEIEKKYTERQLARWRVSENADNYFKLKHDAYLASPAWKQRRRLVMDRAQGLCEGCRLSPPTEVHHLTYLHVGNEFLFELVALCEDCHDRWHAKGIHEALVAGCMGCLHAHKETFCNLHSMPMEMALDPEGPCGLDRDHYELADG